MKTTAVIIFSIALTGCARDLSNIQAKGMTSYELCKDLYRSRLTDSGMATAMKEIESRGESCDKWAGIIAEQNARSRAAYAASQAQSQALINNSRVKQCSSNMIGSTLQTYCY